MTGESESRLVLGQEEDRGDAIVEDAVERRSEDVQCELSELPRLRKESLAHRLLFRFGEILAFTVNLRTPRN